MSSIIAKNSMIRDITLLRRKHWSTWVTIWPFLILYVVSITLYMKPELVWDRITYLLYQTYIDFFHAICFPLVFFLHAFLSLFTTWSVTFRSFILFNRIAPDHMADATHVLVRTREHKGEPEIVPLHPESEDGSPAHFVFQQRKWKFDASTDTFVKPLFPKKLPFTDYIHAKGLNTEEEQQAQLDTYGPNKMEVVIPEFQDLFVDHALAPFFVFQMFCILLWCLDEYWYYSLFSGFMMVGVECTTVFQRLRNMKTLRDMAEIPVRPINVVRGGKTIEIRTDELLPMDIMVVPNNAACPVDAVLIKGTAVVNEASLTGESTPQLKEAPDDSDEALSIKKHARHMVFSGTQILLSSGPSGENKAEKTPALAVVIKTGFETKQGKLLRTILHSQGRVSENSTEAFGFIAVLVVFALAASGHLLRVGLADPTRSRWKLFLSCVQIITSVVPPELPMELSLAVNTSLLALTHLRVFCTEPFRIPYAGMVDTCCFDKTGTLTTDEMLFGGIDMADGRGMLTKLELIPAQAIRVLASCHSLVFLDENTTAGDEMEKAATEALGYRVDENDVVIYDPKPKEPKDGTAAKKPDAGAASKAAGAEKKRDSSKDYKIIIRYPFIASLRRMSCIVSSNEGKFVVAKGSPESICTLCANTPSGMLEIAEKTAAKGYRVIALAYRPLTSEENGPREAITALKRDAVEKDLIFAGLAIYVCPLKRDAQQTIENLIGGSHRCVIITGDSVQTAICVGRDVSMLRSARQLVAREPAASPGQIEWTDSTTGDEVREDKQTIISRTFACTRKHKAPGAEEWDLCVNAEVLSPAAMTRVIEDYNEQITIWARCAPTQKEDIVTDLKKKGHMVMMSGDGTNDVGALKQAHAGIAVLNSASVAPPANSTEIVGPQHHNEPDVPPELLIPPNFKFTEVLPQPPQGAPFSAMMKWKMSEAKRKGEIMQITKWNKQLEANKAAQKAAMPPMPKTEDFMMESLFNSDEEGMGGPPMIKLGDASIAAPFTCRSKALSSVCDIVRLGRSTLVTTHMMYKILALNCLTSAYSMSVLRSDGIQMGEKQMILAGIILSVCFMCMTRSKPLDHLCPQRPITKIFHPYMICTIFLQFALHLYCMIVTAAMVRDVDMETVVAMKNAGEEEKFKPTLLNSTMFLMTTLMSGVTFAVNYRGEPFMQSIRRNRPMFIALLILTFLVFYFASETNPEVNELFEIVAFPTQEFRQSFLKLLVLDFFGCYVIEQASLLLFTDM